LAATRLLMSCVSCVSMCSVVALTPRPLAGNAGCGGER
jgi:hypothetical protein